MVAGVMRRRRARRDPRHEPGGRVRRAARLPRRTLPLDLGIASGTRVRGAGEEGSRRRAHADLRVPPGTGARRREDLCGRRAGRGASLCQPQWVPLAMPTSSPHGGAG